jgi:hypothetical protein
MQDKTGFGWLFQNRFFFHGGCLYVGVSYSPISSEFEQSSRANAL